MTDTVDVLRREELPAFGQLSEWVRELFGPRFHVVGETIEEAWHESESNDTFVMTIMSDKRYRYGRVAIMRNWPIKDVHALVLSELTSLAKEMRKRLPAAF